MSTQFWELIYQGDSELMAGHLHAAIEIYTDTIDQFGHEAHFEKWALEHRAHAHRLNGDPHAALADWDDLLGEKPPVSTWELSNEFFRSNAVLALGEFDSAIELHTTLYETILTDPTRRHKVFDLCWYHPIDDPSAFVFNLNIQDCTDLLMIDPQQLPTLWLRGITKRSKRDWEGAIADFKLVTEVDSTNAYYRNWLHCVLQLQAGLPSESKPHMLLAGSDCYRFYYEIGPQFGRISYFGEGTVEVREYPIDEAQAIERELNDDEEWLMIEHHSHKEGYSVSFWRPDWSAIF